VCEEMALEGLLPRAAFFEWLTEPRPEGSAHGPAGPAMVMKTPCGARTPACRVHILVNAVIDSASLCSQECVRHECLQGSVRTVDFFTNPDAQGYNPVSLLVPRASKGTGRLSERNQPVRDLGQLVNPVTTVKKVPGWL
jgi:hypothetical protein